MAWNRLNNLDLSVSKTQGLVRVAFGFGPIIHFAEGYPDDEI